MDISDSEILYSSAANDVTIVPAMSAVNASQLPDAFTLSWFVTFRISKLSNKDAKGLHFLQRDFAKKICVPPSQSNNKR